MYKELVELKNKLDEIKRDLGAIPTNAKIEEIDSFLLKVVLHEEYNGLVDIVKKKVN